MLTQVQDGKEKVIEYYKIVGTLSPKEIVVSFGMKHSWRLDPIMLSLRNEEGQTAGWIKRRQQYDFKFRHRSGKSHQNVDALFRRRCRADCKHCRQRERPESIKEVSRLIRQLYDG